MTTYTHRLPPHLGGWPCRPMGTWASDGNGVGQLIQLVEYAVQAPEQPRIKRMYIHPGELTELPQLAPEPPSGGAAATDSTVWLRSYRGWFDGFAQEDEILTWEELNLRHPDVRVLVYDPAASAPELPWQMFDDPARYHLRISRSDTGQVEVHPFLHSAFLDAAECVRVAGVLLRAAREARK